jgi:uncharacterized damage-inducible protein DinB
MKELLQQYAAYNTWANKTIIERLSLLSEEQVHTNIASSFPSVYTTVLHLWQAENIWWQRLHLAEHITILSETFKGSFKELAEGFAIQNQQWNEWMNTVTDTELANSFSYIRNKEQHTMSIQDMLLHVFNHATFHRGQLVTLLRQLGETSGIPSTDFSTYCRQRSK